MRIYCNPVNLAYKYQHNRLGKYTYREGADPSLISFKGRYYLFVSMSAGFYYSEDLLHWDYHEDRSLEICSYAPDVAVDGEYLYFSASERFKNSKILRTKDPFAGFEPVSEPFPFWDPHLFFEGETPYLFWGCSNKTPIYVQELSREMQPVGEKKALIFGDEENHGAERKDLYTRDAKSLPAKLINRVLGDKPFIEGAYLNKINEKYYLQYACPGTEYPTYSDCVYVSDAPNGDYVYQQHNPYSIVPTGFATGAGHGSTMADAYGNLWHASTIGVGVNHNYERRVGIWPAGVDEDGILFCNQEFSDYPKEIPQGKFDPLSIAPKWMLLSYQSAAQASSARAEYPVENAVDESIKTAWCAESGEDGEWYRLDLGEAKEVHAVQLNFADVEIPKKKLPNKQYIGSPPFRRYIDSSPENKTSWRLFGSADSKDWQLLHDNSEAAQDRSHELIVLAQGMRLRFLRLDFIAFPYGQRFALSGFRVFGKGNGAAPAPVSGIHAQRHSKTEARIAWQKTADAQGYLLRIGCAPDKLYNSLLLYGQNSCGISFLNAETESCFCEIVAFNENGMSRGEKACLEEDFCLGKE